MLLLLPGSSLWNGRQVITNLLLPEPDALLPDRALFRACLKVSVADFSPVHFLGHFSRQMSYYALFQG
jgi:hypothetical protein